MPATPAPRKLSTAGERRATVLRTAIGAFAARGFYGTTTTEVAAHAGISQAYLYRLFPDKEALFVAVVDHCALRIRECLADGAARAGSGDAEAVLAAMAEAYARLVTDRDLLMVLVQAGCAAGEPAIGAAVHACYARQVEYVRAASGAGEEQVQDFFARTFLCNAVAAMNAEDVDAPWARTLTRDLRRHPPPAA